ncbi:FtsK/SpoIIIE domain-containing protein [Microbacterium sp. ASV81]|uniref:FtsK domain-containing protein n=1 Tax=Microbacterium capsulatum TaxID=3041921 RepID=A0ABU0XHC1_9MICO|nr:FtsK/SpoIIIE domain-containing protein [Microbacterium sp. ASV81]MDQ4214069.1 hypothetical protein [Microbacterium sp. ASV81]
MSQSLVMPPSIFEIENFELDEAKGQDVGLGRFVGRIAKREMVRAGERAIDKYVIGNARPRKSLRSAQPHERIDDIRPDVHPIGVWLRAVVVALGGFGVWILQDIAMSASPGWIIAVVVSLLAFHRAVFKWRLIGRRAAYTHGFFYPTNQLFRDAIGWFGPSRVTVIALVGLVLLELLTQLAGPSSFFAVLAFAAFVIALVGAVVSAIMLGNAYAKDERDQYELLWAYQVKRIEDLPRDGESSLPLKVAHLAETFTGSDLANLQQYAASLGYTITDYDLVGRVRTAQLTPVSPIEMKIYEDAARNLGKPAHDFTFRIIWVENDEPDRNVYPQRIETLIIDRAPIAGLTPEKREAFLLALRDSLPKGSNGWKIIDKQDDPVKVLQYGKPIALPTLVPMRDLLMNIDRREWNRINIGLDHRGDPQGIDLKDGPHSLVVGPTGSGKTIVLRMIAVQALARGHEVIVIDPLKAAVDFARLRDRLKQCAITEIDAGKQIKRVYDEFVRRKHVLIQHERGFWADLDPEVREGEQIRPLTVIIDEFTSLVLPIVLDKNIAKTIEPEEVEQTELINGAKATLQFYVAKIAREARFVGIHLAVATQRPDAKIIDGEFRSQLTSGVLAVKPKSPPEGATLRMVFPSADSSAAAGIVNALDNGSRGLALIGAEGGEVQGIKIGYAPEDDIPALLNELNIPPGQPGFPASAQGTENIAMPELQASLPSEDASKDVSDIFDSDRWKKD